MPTPTAQAITAPSRRGYMLAWAGVAVLSVYLVLIGGGWPGIYASFLRQLSTALAGVVLVAWGLAAWRLPLWRPRSVIWPALVVPVTVFAIATVTSRTPRMSVEYLAYTVLLVGLYLLLQRLMADAFMRPRLASLAAGLGLVIGLLFVGDIVRKWIEWWGLVGHIARPPLRPEFESLTFGNPSAVLTIVVLFWAATLGFVGLSSARRRMLVGGLGVLTILVVVLSGSRAGWLALGLAIPVTLAAWLASSDGRSWAGRAVRSRRFVAALAGTMLAAGALAVVLLPGVLARATAGGEDLRTTYFATALRMFGESPVVGTGPGSWVIQRVEYTRATEPDYYIPHAHNVYLQTLAEFGLLGVAAGIVVVVVVGWLVVAALRHGDRERRTVGWAALFSLLYLSAHHLLDFYPNMPAVMFALALPVAWLDGTSEAGLATGPLPPWARRVATIGLFAGGLLSVGFLAWSETHAAPMAEATAAANDGEWDRAEALARPVAEADGSITAYVATLALTESHAGNHEAAARLFERAGRADDLPQSWLNLAAEQLLLGREDEAREALGRALRLGTQQVIVNVGAADLLLRMGDASAGDEALVRGILLDPSLAGDPTLASRADIAPRWPAIIDTAIDRASDGAAWEIALVAGRPDQARELAASLPEPSRPSALLVVDAWGGDESAYAELQTLAEERPLDAMLVSWCGRIANRFGLEDDHDRYTAWTGMLVLGTTGELRVVDADAALGSRAGSLAAYYGHYTYRRPTPWDLVVPSLPHLVLR